MYARLCPSSAMKGGVVHVLTSFMPLIQPRNNQPCCQPTNRQDGVEERNVLTRNLAAYVHTIGNPAGGPDQSGTTHIEVRAQQQGSLFVEVGMLGRTGGRRGWGSGVALVGVVVRQRCLMGLVCPFRGVSGHELRLGEGVCCSRGVALCHLLTMAATLPPVPPACPCPTHPSPHKPHPTPQSPDLTQPADAAAAGFYSANPNNIWEGNAASGGFAGFSFPTLPKPIGVGAHWVICLTTSALLTLRPGLLLDHSLLHPDARLRCLLPDLSQSYEQPSSHLSGSTPLIAMPSLLWASTPTQEFAWMTSFVPSKRPLGRFNGNTAHSTGGQGLSCLLMVQGP